MVRLGFTFSPEEQFDYLSTPKHHSLVPVSWTTYPVWTLLPSEVGYYKGSGWVWALLHPLEVTFLLTFLDDSELRVGLPLERGLQLGQ